jgi:hypothetical protein
MTAAISVSTVIWPADLAVIAPLRKRPQPGGRGVQPSCGPAPACRRRLRCRARRCSPICGRRSASVTAYPTLDGFLADVVQVLCEEVRELGLGCTYIQMDAPQYPLLIDPGWRAFYEERGLAAAALAGVRDRT